MSRPVVIDFRSYPSLAAAERATGLTRYKLMLINGMSHNPKPQKYTWRGIDFATQKEVAEYAGCAHETVSRVFRNGWLLKGHPIE